jgi:hypothetical protein
MAASVISGASGDPPLVFMVTPGTTPGSGANLLSALFQGISASGAPMVDINAQVTTPGALNEISSAGATGQYTIDNPGQYVYNASGSAISITGSSADTVIAGGDTTFDATGTDNEVVFTDGTNDYEGGTSTDGYIAAGSGYDTINVGSGGGNSVFGGGHADITFGDTSAAGAGDVAYLGSGTNTVTSGAGADTVVAYGGGNVIFGGTGTLTFVAQNFPTPVTNSVDGAAGGTSIFGGANEDVMFYSPGGATSSDQVFVAGGGNETLDGGASAGGFSYFGSTGVNSIDSIIGGSSGSDYFQTGSGTENFVLNGAATMFDLTTSAGGSSVITIDNWNTALDTISGDTVGAFFGTLPDGNLSLTLSDNTVIEFIGLTSSTQVHTK